MAARAERTFLPPWDAKSVWQNCQQQVEELLETLVLRVIHGPEVIWYEADDAKHVGADVTAAAEKSIGVLKKVTARDLTKTDDMKFLGVPNVSGLKPRVLLMETYMWTGLCVLGYLMGVIVGDYSPATDIIRPIFVPVNSLIVALFIPVYYHSRLRKAYWPDEEQRSIGFYGAVMLGMSLSYAVGKPSVPFAPFVALIPTWIGLVCGYHEIRPIGRFQFLIQCMVPPWVVYWLYYMTSDSSTLLAWCALSAVITADLQLKLGRFRRRWAGKEMEQWDTTVVIVYTHFLLSHFVSMFASNDDAPE